MFIFSKNQNKKNIWYILKQGNGWLMGGGG